MVNVGTVNVSYMDAMGYVNISFRSLSSLVFALHRVSSQKKS